MKVIKYRGKLFIEADGRGERYLGEVASAIEEVRLKRSIFAGWANKAQEFAESFEWTAKAFEDYASGKKQIFDDSPAARDAYGKAAKAIRKEIVRFKKAAAALKGI